MITYMDKRNKNSTANFKRITKVFTFQSEIILFHISFYHNGFGIITKFIRKAISSIYVFKYFRITVSLK